MLKKQSLKIKIYAYFMSFETSYLWFPGGGGAGKGVSGGIT